MKQSFQTRMATPLGPMTALRIEEGLAGLWFDGQKHHPGALDALDVGVGDDPVFARVATELARYFGGQGFSHKLREIPLAPQGTAFQQEVWQMLIEIPAGSSSRYGELAAQLGRPQAARAVGAAVGRNPVSILIPCHRVLGMAGSLTGYAGGIDRKIALLTLEGASFAALRSAA